MAEDSSVGGWGVSRAFQFADIQTEGNEIVDHKGFEPAEARFDFAVEPPPHKEQGGSDYVAFLVVESTILPCLS